MAHILGGERVAGLEELRSAAEQVSDGEVHSSARQQFCETGCAIGLSLSRRAQKGQCKEDGRLGSGWTWEGDQQPVRFARSHFDHLA